MINYKIVLEYDGTKYNGWQKQGNTDNTIQAKLEKVLKKMAGYEVEVNGSGRTDAGVHAVAQVANFKLNEGRDDVLEYLNKYLPEDIRIISCEEADERFHARLNAKGKTYMYRMCVGGKPSVFERKYVYALEEKLDVEAMRKAGRELVGEFDFKAFCSNKKSKKSTVRNIFNIEIDEIDDEIRFIFSGDGFLHNMIRIIVGTLIEVGEHKKKPEDMLGIIESGDRENAGYTVPPNGLCLLEVKY